MPSGRGGTAAELPFVVEAWVERAAEEGVEVFANRTPITGTVSVTRQKERTDLGLFGCGLKHRFTVGRPPVRLYLHVVAPYVPIISNGKNPDLRPFIAEITHAVEQAARKARRDGPAKGGRTLGNWWRSTSMRPSRSRAAAGPTVTPSASSTTPSARFSRRSSPAWRSGGSGFAISLILADYEAAYSHRHVPGHAGHPLPPAYRPEIPLGTLAVEDYAGRNGRSTRSSTARRRAFPPASFGEVAGTADDFALMSPRASPPGRPRTSATFSARPARRSVVFCVHDADAYGTMIYQSLQERDQGARGPQGEGHQPRPGPVGGGRRWGFEAEPFKAEWPSGRVERPVAGRASQARMDGMAPDQPRRVERDDPRSSWIGSTGRSPRTLAAKWCRRPSSCRRRVRGQAAGGYSREPHRAGHS